MASEKIQIITTLHSQSTSREIINNNFRLLQLFVTDISEIDIKNLKGIIFPSNPVNGTTYVLVYTAGQYVVTPAPSMSAGNKVYIRAGDKVIINQDYQYLVHNKLTVDGEIDVEGELVIFN